MPFKAKEFAVNRLLKYDIPYAFVKDSDNRLVGWIEGYDESTGEFRFTAYQDANYEETSFDKIERFPYIEILGQAPYLFGGDNPNSRPCRDTSYQLVYRKSGQGGLMDSQFDICLADPPTRDIKYQGKTVGKIYDINSDPDYGLSGNMQFDPNVFENTDMSAYLSGDGIHAFRGSEPVYIDRCKFTFQPNPACFICEAGLSNLSYCGLSGGLSGFRVYEKDVIRSGESGRMTQFDVQIPFGSGLSGFTLKEAAGFSAVCGYDLFGRLSVLSYDMQTETVSLTEKAERLSCAVRVADREIFEIPLSAGTFNTELSVCDTAYMSLNPLSVAVMEAFLDLTLADGYKLYRCEYGLSGRSVSEDGEVEIRLSADGGVSIMMHAGDNTVILGNDGDNIDWTSGVCADESRDLGSSVFTGEQFGEIDERCEMTRTFAVAGSYSGSQLAYLGLNLTKKYTPAGGHEYGTDDIVIEIPDKDPDCMSKSREFLFTLNPVGTGKAALRLVTPQGQPIRFFTEHGDIFEIDCGTFTTFRLQEISNGVFSLLDWDQSVQDSRITRLEHRFDDLSAQVKRDIENISSEVGDLSGFVYGTLNPTDDGEPGLLKLRDEHYYEDEGSFRKYEMHMISGTIKLVKIA